MPWQPKDLMDIKREFVELALREGVNRRELCRRSGIGTKAAYELLARILGCLLRQFLTKLNTPDAGVSSWRRNIAPLLPRRHV